MPWVEAKTRFVGSSLMKGADEEGLVLRACAAIGGLAWSSNEVLSVSGTDSSSAGAGLR